MKHNIQRNLYMTTFLTDLSVGLLIFAVSRELAEKGAGLAFLGVLGGIFSFGWALSSVLCGRLSDRFGRKRLVCCGIACLFTSSVGCTLLQSHLLFTLVFYCLGGISGGMIYPALIAWLNRGQNSVGTRSQATGALIRFCIAWNLGFMSSHFSAGIFFAFESRLPLCISGLFSVINMWVILSTDGSTEFKSEKRPSNPKEAASAIFAKISWIANLSGAFAMGLVLHLFPDLAVSLGVPAESHGTMLAIMRIVIIATYLTMHHLIFWHHRFVVIVVMQTVGLSGLLILTCAVSQTWLIIGLCFLGFLVGFNYFASLYYSTTSSHVRRKGLTSGIHEATLALGIFGGSLIGGLAGALMGPRAPYWFSIIVLIGFFLAQTYTYIRSKRLNQHS